MGCNGLGKALQPSRVNISKAEAYFLLKPGCDFPATGTTFFIVILLFTVSPVPIFDFLK